MEWYDKAKNFVVKNRGKIIAGAGLIGTCVAGYFLGHKILNEYHETSKQIVDALDAAMDDDKEIDVAHHMCYDSFLNDMSSEFGYDKMVELDDLHFNELGDVGKKLFEEYPGMETLDIVVGMVKNPGD